MKAQPTSGTARSRPVSPLESRLLEALKRRDRATRRPRSNFVLRSDRPWLEAEVGSPYINQLVRRMVSKGTLFELGGGRYVVAPQGSQVLSQAASFELALDARLRAVSPYYLGYFSALKSHELTDLGGGPAYVAVASEKTRGKEIEIAGRPVRLVRLSFEERWLGVEEVPLRERSSYFRSDLERTLLDCLDRPELCGTLEVTTRAWERALSRSRVNLDQLSEYALKLGGVLALRCAFWLYELGEAQRSDDLLARLTPKPRSGSMLLDPSRQFGDGEWARDRRTGLRVNVPQNLIRGWISYGK